MGAWEVGLGGTYSHPKVLPIPSPSPKNSEPVPLLIKGTRFSSSKSSPMSFIKTSSIPLPPVLLQQSASTLQARWSLTLLPSISRVCLTIDNKIFLWMYSETARSTHYSLTSQPSDICMYDGLDQLITSIIVLPPLPNVFEHGIHHLLAVATAAHVVLLAIKFDREDDVKSPLRLIPTGLAVSLDDHPVTSMVSSSTGRLFLSLANGSLEELVYHTSSKLLSWIPFVSSHHTGSAKRVVHVKGSLSNVETSLYIDNSRKILYSVIPNVKREGWRGLLSRETPSEPTSLSAYSFTDNSSSHLRLLGKLKSPSSGLTESQGNVAFESRGIVSLGVVDPNEKTTAEVCAVLRSGARLFLTASDGLRVVHKILPLHPMRDLNLQHQNYVVRKATSRGKLTTLGVKGSTSDCLILIGHDPLTCSPSISASTEISHSFSLEGRVFFISDISQFSTDSSPCVLVLTSTHLLKFEQQRALDIVASLSPDSDELERTAINCGFVELNVLVIKLLLSNRIDLLPSTTIINSTNLERIFLKYSMRPVQAPTVLFGGNSEVLVSSQLPAGLVAFSKVYENLVSNIWNSRIFVIHSVKSSLFGGSERVFLTFAHNCQVYSDTCKALKSLLDLARSRQLFKFILTSSTPNETKQLDHIIGLIELSYQALFIVERICNKIGGSKQKLALIDTKQSKEIESVLFSRLVTTPRGKELIGNVIFSALQAPFPNDPSSKPALKFSEDVPLIGLEAPLFFSAEDQSRIRAEELLESASRILNSVQKPRTGTTEQERKVASLVKEAAEMLKVASVPISLLSPLFSKFATLSAFSELISIAINLISNLDQYSISYRESRDLIYSHLMENISIPFSTTLHPLEGEIVNTPEYNQKLKDEIVDLILSSTDKDLHFAFYDWFVLRHTQDVLLAFPPSNYLEEYLRNLYQRNENVNLLCTFYIKHRQHGSAAQVLYHLASSTPSLSLFSRIDYLSRALTNAKAASLEELSNPNLLEDISDSLEIAEIQKRILERLGQNSGSLEKSMQEIETAKQQLSTDIKTVSELYNNFAVIFDDTEGCIEILKSSKYLDENLIAKLWTSYFEKQKKRCRTFALFCDNVSKFFSIIYPAPTAFPLGTIISMLQEVALSYSTEGDLSIKPESVALFLKNCNISLSEILDSYSSLVLLPSVSAASVWSEEFSRNWLYSGLIEFIYWWISTAQNRLGSSLTKNLRQKRSEIYQILDWILVRCDSPALSDLVQKSRQLLERI
ncbi:hypothetical protein RCL1_000165 [Eukaryota sp. TZLM3-RCL]